MLIIPLSALDCDAAARHRGNAATSRFNQPVLGNKDVSKCNIITSIGFINMQLFYVFKVFQIHNHQS